MLIPTPAIRNLIREDKITRFIRQCRRAPGRRAVQTFNQGLVNAYLQKQVTL